MPQRLKWGKLRFGITAKILIAFLILSIVSLSVIGTLAYSSIKNIGSNSIDTSTPALEKLAQNNLSSLASGLASESGILFEKVATQADELADYASTLWTNKAQLLASAPYNPPIKRDSDNSYNYIPDKSVDASLCHVPAEINLDTIKDTIRLTGYMDDVFRSVMEKNLNVSGVYFGTIDGVFRVYPGTGGIPVGYKYKERPWYLKGAGLSKLDRGGWTNPFLDAAGKGYKITRSTPVFAKDGSRIGVIGVDILINIIKQRIVDLPVGTLGYAFIVDKSGTFIARPGIEAGEEKWDEIFALDKLLNTKNTELNTIADKIYAGNSGIELSKLTTRTIYLNIASVIDNNIPDFSWNKFLNDDSLQYYEVKIDNNNWLNNGKYTIFMANNVLSDGYHSISVRAVDNAGKITDQANLSFCIKTQSLNQTTPVISNIKIIAISQESVTINWLTNNETTSQVSYSKDTSYRNSTPVDTSLVTSHSASIKGLEAGVTYHYRVKSIDSQGNESISGDNTFQVKSEQKYLAYAPIQATGLSIVIVSPVSEILASAHMTAAYIASEQGKLQRIFAGVIAGILIIVVLFTFWLARRLTKPILKIKEETSLIGAGNLDHRINIKTGDEIEDLANSFNKMASDLKAYTAELQRTTAEKERMAKELEIAKGIQQNFLPEFAPVIEGLELAGFNLPAWEVGGDFYDFIPVDTGKWGLVIADVSGKGVPAALFMALSRTLIRAYSIGSPKVSEAILRANEMISEDDRSGMFVTLFYGVLDVEKRTLTYVNAGHNSPIMLDTNNGVVILLAAKGIAIGVMAGITLEEKTVSLKKGDVIALYTDGATEAINRKGEQFGTERLTQLVTECSGLPAAEIIDRIQKQVTEFSEGQPQFDDVTLMILKVD